MVMAAREHFHTDTEGHKKQVREKLERRVERQNKIMMGAFWASVVLGGIVTVALVITWLSHGGAAH